MTRLPRWLSRRRERSTPVGSQRGSKGPQLDRKDIVAVIIALFQLFAPLVLGLLAVAVIVSVVLLNIK